MVIFLCLHKAETSSPLIIAIGEASKAQVMKMPLPPDDKPRKIYARTAGYSIATVEPY